MAVNDRAITIDFRVLLDKLKSGMREGSAELKKFESDTKDTVGGVEESTERISRLWRSAFEAFLGFEAVNALKRIALGAAEAADQLAIAARVAQNFGHALDPTKMENWLEAFSRSKAGGGYGVDEMRAAVQEFSTLGLDVAQQQRAIADTANLAAARNISFAEATNIVRQALTGHVEMLTRYGVISREAAKNIKTVEEAMQALEKATAGAAAERANTLPGALGRLASSASLLRDSFGRGLIPIFTDLANAMTNIADALNRIPQPIMNAIASFTALTVGLAATVLFLPAIRKGFDIILEGFRLVGAIGAPLIDVLMGVGRAFLLVRDGSIAAAAGELLAAAAPALIIAGIAALSVVIIELLRHFEDWKALWSDLMALLADKWRAFVEDFEQLLKPLGQIFGTVMKAISDAWNAFATYLHDRWDEFVKGFTEQFNDVVRVFDKIISALKPVMDAWDEFCSYLNDRFDGFVSKLGAQADEVHSILQSMTIGFGIGGPLGALIGGVGGAGGGSDRTRQDQGQVGRDFSRIWGHLSGDANSLKAAIGNLGNLFKSSLGPTPNIPGEPFTGNIPGGSKGKDTSAQQAENAMKNFLDGIKQALAEYETRTADAKHNVAKATTAVDQYKAGLPGGAPQNEQQAAELQKLISNELRAQQALHDRLVEQQRAELLAQQSIEQAAARISPHLKNHDELVRQARDAALEHLHTAQALGEQYLRIGVTVAELRNSMREAFEKGLSNEAQAQIDALEAALAMRKIGYDEQSEGVTAQLDKMRVTKGSKPVEEDRLKIQLAELALAAAQDTLAVKEHALAIAQDDYNRDKSTDNLNKLNQAEQQLATSTLDVVKANDSLNLAQDQLIVDQKQKWDDFINSLVQKANVPGLSGSAQAGFSFNPLGLLMDALSKTQMFGDIMNTVTSIVNTFALALNALRPVIDALLQVIRAVANVFIFMYNAVARILDLFGLQIQQLQYLTDAMQGLIPLISIWHEIPTLNELAAGRLNSPLSTVPQGYNNIGQTQGGQNTLMRVVEILTGILMAIVIEKVLTGMSLQQAVQSTLHLIGINVGTKMNNVLGQTNNALTTTTNGLLSTGFATANGLLTQILAALQMGGVGGGGIFGLLSGGGAAGGLGGVFGLLGAMGKTLGGSGGPFGPDGAVGQAARSLSDGFRVATSSLSEHVRQLDRAAAAAARFSEAVDRATASANRMAFAGGGSISELNTALSRDTSRRGTASHGFDRF